MLLPESDKPACPAASLEAERGMRDLLGLLALSALWQGRDGATVMEQMLSAVERLVPIRFAYAQARLLDGEQPTVTARVAGVPLNQEACLAWQHSTSGWSRTVNVGRPDDLLSPTPIGDMQISRMEMGVSTLQGTVWFGSDRPGFPTTTELAILRAATSLAATAIQAAKIAHERNQANQAKDEFLAMLGHELRNPLAPIRMGASLVLRDGVTPEQVKKTGLILERQVGHITGLVDSLLDVSRLATGAVVLSESEVDMKEVVRDAFEQISPLIHAKSHQVVLSLPEENAPVFGDRNRLVQVVANLLNNATRYTGAGGRIALDLALVGQQVSICVSDNGIGIEAAMLKRVFELFTQAKRSADRSEGGLGVGLALARQLVELHGGTLQARSQGLGHGAQFEVLLQRRQLRSPVAPPCLPVPATATAPACQPGLNIVVVDDNRDGADTLAEMLQLLGHQVRVCYHPRDALLIAADVAAEVYLLDIGLPEMDGYELARRLKRQLGGMRHTLVALTGYGQADDLRKAREAGFDQHCVKPISLEKLQAILRQAGH